MNTEKELFESIKFRDQKALEQLYHSYFPRLSRFITQITQDPHETLDVINEVFMVVWNDASRFRGDSSISSWIMGIAYNKALSALRKKRHWLSFSNDLDEQVDETIYTSDQEDIRRVMKKLKPEQRAMVELTYFFGYSYQEISEILDCKSSLVRHQLYVARKQMKQRIQTGI